MAAFPGVNLSIAIAHGTLQGGGRRRRRSRCRPNSRREWIQRMPSRARRSAVALVFESAPPTGQSATRDPRVGGPRDPDESGSGSGGARIRPFRSWTPKGQADAGRGICRRRRDILGGKTSPRSPGDWIRGAMSRLRRHRISRAVGPSLKGRCKCLRESRSIPQLARSQPCMAGKRAPFSEAWPLQRPRDADFGPLIPDLALRPYTEGFQTRSAMSGIGARRNRLRWSV